MSDRPPSSLSGALTMNGCAIARVPTEPGAAETCVATAERQIAIAITHATKVASSERRWPCLLSEPMHKVMVRFHLGVKEETRARGAMSQT